MNAMPEDVRIEVHRTPPDQYEGTSENIGHLKAVGQGASVILPCSLELLDDPKVLDHYIKTRLLLFHKMEVDRAGGQATR